MDSKLEKNLIKLSELYKMFGDSTRVKILYVLLKKNMYVSEIAEELNISQSATSHQLRLLKQASLVSSSKANRNVIYSLADEHVKSIIETGLEHVNE